MSLASVIRYVRALDSAATDGSGKTGLAFGDVTAKYLTLGSTLVSLTTETITTLGTYQAPTSNAHLRIKELNGADPTKGVYEVHFHDDQVAAAGKKLLLFLSAAGAAFQPLEVELVPYLYGNAAAADNAKKYFDGTGYGDIMQRTTIAVVNSQTSFTLAAGSADDDVYNNAIIVFEDQNTAAQKAYGFVLDYAGSTKTVTLLAGPGFTIAVGDVVTIRAAQYLNLTLNGSGQVGVYTIATAAAQIIADNVLSRNVSNVEGVMPEHCLGTVVLAMLENDLLSTPGSLIIYRTDGTTIHVTKALTTDPAAEPIVKVE